MNYLGTSSGPLPLSPTWHYLCKDSYGETPAHQYCVWRTPTPDWANPGTYISAHLSTGALSASKRSGMTQKRVIRPKPYATDTRAPARARSEPSRPRANGSIRPSCMCPCVHVDAPTARTKKRRRGRIPDDAGPALSTGLSTGHARPSLNPQRTPTHTSPGRATRRPRPRRHAVRDRRARDDLDGTARARDSACGGGRNSARTSSTNAPRASTRQQRHTGAQTRLGYSHPRSTQKRPHGRYSARQEHAHERPRTRARHAP